jgi:hypothetical protein
MGNEKDRRENKEWKGKMNAKERMKKREKGKEE